MKNVLITGASGCLGLELVNSLACSYNLILVYNKNRDSLEKLVAGLNKKNDVLLVKCDLASEKGIKNLVELVVERFKKIDILINNAAIYNDDTPEVLDQGEFLNVLNINL